MKKVREVIQYKTISKNSCSSNQKRFRTRYSRSSK